MHEIIGSARWYSPCDGHVNTSSNILGQGCQDVFGYTLAWNQIILLVIPSLCLLTIFPLRIAQLSRQQIKVSQGALQFYKLIAIIAYGCLQVVLVFLSARSLSQPLVPILATSLSLINTIIIATLSTFEHRRSLRPSSILCLYLLLSILLDIAQYITFWLDQPSALESNLLFLGTILKFIMLILENKDKNTSFLLPYKGVSPEAYCGILDSSLFLWLNPLLYKGYKYSLKDNDLYVLDESLSSNHLQQQLQKIWIERKWKEESKGAMPSHALLKASLSMLKWPLISAFPQRLCVIVFKYLQPLIINTTINYINRSTFEKKTSDSYMLIYGTLIIYIGLAVSNGAYKYRMYRVVTKLRGSLISIIYNKTLTQPIHKSDESTAITLMSTDVDRITNAIEDVNEIWANIIEVGIAIWLLEREIGLACIAPVFIVILSTIVMLRVSPFMGESQALWNEAVGKRVSVTSSMLSSMKSVLLTGLNERISMDIQALRIRELDLSRSFRKLIVYMNVIANSSAILSPVITFSIVVLINQSDGIRLTVARAFTALSIIALLCDPLASLLTSVPSLTASTGCFNRIQEYLLSPEPDDSRNFEHRAQIRLRSLTPSNEPLITPKVDEQSSDYIISLEDASFGVRLDVPILYDINFKIPPGTLAIVVGPIGSGKSSLLESCLGEIPCLKGRITLRSKKIAYCGQKAWLVNGTIEDNILGECEFDEEWYTTVIKACDLRFDFAQIPFGDKAVVGSGGINLSGGQKQRIALARAIYSRPELLLLDDVISGLDLNTASNMMSSLLGKEGRLVSLGTTIVLATHSTRYLHLADQILVLGENGTIVEQGSLAYLQEQSEYINRLLVEDQSDADQETNKENEEDTTECMVPPSRKDELEEVHRETGDAVLYKYYFKSIGIRRGIILLTLDILYVFLLKFPDIWLRLWAESVDHDQFTNMTLYLTVYVVLGLLGLVIIGVTIWFWFVSTIPKSANSLHQTLLTVVMSAPLSFFSSTDSGAILNRFSQDMALVDMSLPASAFTTLFGFFMCIAEAILIISGANTIVITIPFVILIVYFLQQFYLRTSRQLRFLELEAKSPLYTHFTETIDGLATIRAFRYQKTFEAKSLELLDASQRPYYLLHCIQRWLNLVLDLTVAGIAVLLVGFAILSPSEVSGGAVAVALVNILAFNQSLANLITSWTSLETSLGAISRLRDFERDTESEEQKDHIPKAPKGWPEKGAIKFENVTVSYTVGAEPVLHNINLDIQEGQKVGICGRTGSGKSTLILTLLRLINPTSGQITISYHATTTLPLHTLRSNLTTIPQDPVFLHGSIRYNLDPTLSRGLSDILTALRKVKLDRLVPATVLNDDMSTLKLSRGQHQLFQLAGAILKRSCILILDEATSDMDSETEQLVTKVLEEEFVGCTVIAIVHRLNSVLRFDKIAVMDKGKIVEFDDPKELLDKPSYFRDLYRSKEN